MIELSRADAPLDLAAIHRALDGVAALSDLRLGRYEATSLRVYAETSAPPPSLALAEALAAALGGAVQGNWSGDRFVAEISPRVTDPAPARARGGRRRKE